MQDVDAVAVFAEPAQGTKGADARDEWRAEGEDDEADGGDGDGGEVEGKVDLKHGSVVEQRDRDR